MVLYQLSAGHNISEIRVVEYFLLCGSAVSEQIKEDYKRGIMH